MRINHIDQKIAIHFTSYTFDEVERLSQKYLQKMLVESRVRSEVIEGQIVIELDWRTIYFSQEVNNILLLNTLKKIKW